MGYTNAITYLYGLQKFGIKLGLDNIRAMAGLLGNPQDSYRSLHIAGTNGKGTTAAVLAWLLTCSGLPTGLFTSPHLVRFTERIRMNGQEMSQADVISLTGRINEAIEGQSSLSPTFFEFVTAMAFQYFKDEHAQWAVFEAGMGGRFDATNILTPKVSIITNISEDHKEFLGDTVRKIAEEKAGIIKPEVAVVSASQDPEALEAIEERAQQTGSPLFLFGRDFHACPTRTDIKGITFDYQGKSTLKGVAIPFTARVQVENAACALRAWEEVLAQEGWTNREDQAGQVEKKIIDRAQFPYHALSTLRWPGRSELVHFEGRSVLLDGAHNPKAALELARTLKDVYLNSSVEGSFQEMICIVGTMADKDSEKIIKPLLPLATEAIFTAPAYGRAEKPQRLLALARSLHVPQVILSTAPSTREGLARACHSGKPDALVLVTGSFYTVGEAKEAMGEDTTLKDLAEFR